MEHSSEYKTAKQSLVDELSLVEYHSFLIPPITTKMVAEQINFYHEIHKYMILSVSSLLVHFSKPHVFRHCREEA